MENVALSPGFGGFCVFHGAEQMEGTMVPERWTDRHAGRRERQQVVVPWSPSLLVTRMSHLQPIGEPHSSTLTHFHHEAGEGTQGTSFPIRASHVGSSFIFTSSISISLWGPHHGQWSPGLGDASGRRGFLWSAELRSTETRSPSTVPFGTHLISVGRSL
uniref:Uncharacterized protein n=1 Tax=Molossus molossus TaxID=27622 RepID=A0A7J8DQC4_MOLMO|nr:hypothetical protein HJG59_009247 [Molossus molossus]